MDVTIKHVVRVCPICLHRSGEVLHHQRFAIPDNHSLPDAYDVVACQGCGFVYADTPAKQADYDRYYRRFSKYEDPDVSTGGGATEWDAKRLERTASDIAAFLPDTSASVLDIGCANGGLLESLKIMGYFNLTGLDPSSACISTVSKRGIPAFVGGFFSYAPADSHGARGPFDCGILCHVLEHVYDLRIAVENTIRRLKTGGILYVEVPDASRYSAYHAVPFYYFDCEHINHFDEHSLNNLFSQFGCEKLAAVKKDIRASSTNIYPVVYTIFRKTGVACSSPVVSPDDRVRESVIAHVRRSLEASSSYRCLEEFASTRREIVVWGAGSYTLRLLENTPLGRCNIVAFIDNDTAKQGTRLRDIAIIPPGAMKGHSGPILISSALHGEEIVKEIKNMGIGNDVIVL